MSGLSVRNLTKRFGPVVAVEGISLDVAAGSRAAVIGPSGSGKTTLLRLLAGLEAPYAGAIELDGERLADASAGVPSHRRRIGLVMQEGALFPHLDVLDNIRFGIRREPDAETRALRLLDLVELARGVGGRYPHQLSGGQQQRVALARALARQPRIMLLDEPFAALDAGLREQLRQMTAELLRDAGIATVLVTHDRSEAMEFADQLVVLRDGRLVQSGPPRDLYLAPADPETAAFLGPAIIVDGTTSGGYATCALGTVPIADGRPVADSRARILLRPEQLTISALSKDDGDAFWQLAQVHYIGATARVTIVYSERPSSLTFETPARNLPPAGSRISISLSGAGHLYLYE